MTIVTKARVLILLVTLALAAAVIGAGMCDGR